jgi:hypothetical protein
LGPFNSFGKEQLTFAASVRSSTISTLKEEQLELVWEEAAAIKSCLLLERSSLLKLVRGEEAAYLSKSPGKSSLAEQLKQLT